MHPQDHEDPITARAENLERKYGQQSRVVYTEAADSAREHAMTAVVTDTVRTHTSVSLRRTNILQAEETAIALAITQAEAMTFFSDSQGACRNYMNGRI
ncbi:hypothetical protein HPB48_018262 [Haemaphysalis longicornis]|uniref:Uncharacterized protein n=1 Tax=Haemaphysalis longicornis TaxID=44386 RepID=A0A9J6F9Q1_HAELO|nr:hypothetical protein HPB48_018262 [Haemaphysalis longicornis]